MAHRSGSIQATLGWSSGDMNGVVGHASCLRYLLFDISKRKAHDCTLICIYIPTEPHTYLLFWGWKQPISCIYIQKPTWLHPFWTEHPKPTKTRFSPKYPGYFEDPAFSWCIGLEGNYIYIYHIPLRIHHKKTWTEEPRNPLPFLAKVRARCGLLWATQHPCGGGGERRLADTLGVLKTVIENHWTSWKASLTCWKHH